MISPSTGCRSRLGWLLGLSPLVLASYVVAAPATEDEPVLLSYPIGELPKGVRYSTASPEVVGNAAASLRRALGGRPADLLALLGPEDGGFEVVVGPYIGMDIHGVASSLPGLFGKAAYRMNVGDEKANVSAPASRATSAAQKRLLAQYLFRAFDFSTSPTIRAATFDELALTWYWIGWDLDEPLLVADFGAQKILFDFEPATGRIKWIESLGRPCFVAQQGERKLTECKCARVHRQDSNWSVAFESAKTQCEARAANPLAPLVFVDKGGVLVITREGGTKEHRDAVFLTITARTTTGDTWLLKEFSNDFVVVTLPESQKQFKSVGKPLRGGPPQAPVDADGKALTGYVMLGSVVSEEGKFIANRGILYTDERLLAAVLAAAAEWEVEPATYFKRPTRELVWMEFSF